MKQALKQQDILVEMQRLEKLIHLEKDEESQIVLCEKWDQLKADLYKIENINKKIPC